MMHMILELISIMYQIFCHSYKCCSICCVPSYFECVKSKVLRWKLENQIIKKLNSHDKIICECNY